MAATASLTRLPALFHLLWMRFLKAHIPLHVAPVPSLPVGAVIVARG
jgi:hypothetical protein